jgi:hypothetical protein
MHGLVVAPGNRYLDPVDKAQPDFVRGGPRLGQAAEFVVVGQRQQFDAVSFARRTTSAGESSPSDTVEWQCRSALSGFMREKFLDQRSHPLRLVMMQVVAAILQHDFPHIHGNRRSGCGSPRNRWRTTA